MNSRFTLDIFEQRLAAHQPDADVPECERAAVAALIEFRDDGPHVLLMQRAEREGDRWSGQVALPGGRAEPVDSDLLATAARETREEVGVDLFEAGRLLGQLDPIQAQARGGPVPLTITPFVFARRSGRPVELSLGPEAAAAFWFPLEPAARGELDDVYPYEYRGSLLKLDCWRYDERVVWGLTYRMLRTLLRVVGGG